MVIKLRCGSRQTTLKRLSPRMNRQTPIVSEEFRKVLLSLQEPPLVCTHAVINYTHSLNAIFVY